MVGQPGIWNVLSQGVCDATGSLNGSVDMAGCSDDLALMHWVLLSQEPLPGPRKDNKNRWNLSVKQESTSDSLEFKP